jgi:hypothetical protein
MTAEFVPVESPEATEIRSIGERAISRVAYSMVNEAAKTVASVGPTQSLSVCHLKFLPSTGAVISDMPRVTALKRTSLRLRDPANAPDAADQAALDRVQRALEAGDSAPKILVQRVERTGSPAEWRVYRPIGVLAQCLPCHGPTDEMSDEFRAELKRRFPNDAATGYSLGEWRGVIRVSIAPASAPTKKN